MANILQTNDDRKLRMALNLIKEHMTAEATQQNIDLHQAIGMIVDVARNNGLLLTQARQNSEVN